MKKKNVLSPIMLLLAAMCWGFAFTAQDAASDVPPFILGACRSLIAGVFLIFVIMILDKVLKTNRKLFSKKGIDLKKEEIIGGIICGIILAVASAFQQIGIAGGTDGGKAAFITALYVVLVPIYALVLKKKAPFNVWLSVGIALIGFYFLCIKDDLSMAFSDIYVIIGALIFPIHILTIDHFTEKCDGVRMSAVQFFAATLVNIIFALFMESSQNLGLIGENILSIIYLGVVSSGVAYTLQIVGQRGVNPAVASIILSLESVFGVMGTAIFLKQTLTVREYLGCFIVLFAVILSQLNFKFKKEQSK